MGSFRLKKIISKEFFSELLQDNDDSPVSFAKSREIYFISETVENMTEKEIKYILNDSINLNTNILMISS